MDQVIEFAVGMMERNWNELKDDLKDITDDELDWRPVPESNSIRSIVRHLRTVEQLYLSRLEDAENSPWKDNAAVQKLAESATYDFPQIMKEFEDFRNRFVSWIQGSTMADLKAQTFPDPSSPPGIVLTKDSMISREIRHMITHRGQIRTLRNLYRRTKGKKGLFSPENESFRE